MHDYLEHPRDRLGVPCVLELLCHRGGQVGHLCFLISHFVLPEKKLIDVNLVLLGIGKPLYYFKALEGTSQALRVLVEVEIE